MIHYMTTRGTSDAWVVNELRVVARAGIPFRLHALRRSEASYFVSEDAAQIAAQTQALYPLPRGAFIAHVLAAPFVFRGRFIAALWNALTGPRETLRVRLVGLWHFLIACHWAMMLRNGAAPVSHIHSQWIHSAGTVAMFGAWLLFSETPTLRMLIGGALIIVAIVVSARMSGSADKKTVAAEAASH